MKRIINIILIAAALVAAPALTKDLVDKITPVEEINNPAFRPFTIAVRVDTLQRTRVEFPPGHQAVIENITHRVIFSPADCMNFEGFRVESRLSDTFVVVPGSLINFHYIPRGEKFTDHTGGSTFYQNNLNVRIYPLVFGENLLARIWVQLDSSTGQAGCTFLQANMILNGYMVPTD